MGVESLRGRRQQGANGGQVHGETVEIVVIHLKGGVLIW